MTLMSHLLLDDDGTDNNNAFGGGSNHYNRRNFITTAALASSSLGSTAASAAGGSSSISGSKSLAEKLSKRDPSVLINSIFNIPPTVQIYPDFMKGTWKVSCKYGGYLFPSKKISKEK